MKRPCNSVSLFHRLDTVGTPADPSVSGIFGTPNYVVNGEIFWGQDRLDYVELRIKELIEAGATPAGYPKLQTE